MEPQDLLMKITELQVQLATVATRVNVLWAVFMAGAVAYGGHNFLRRGNNGYKTKSDKILNAVADKILNGKV